MTYTLTSTPDKITPQDVAKITSGRPFSSGASRQVFDLGTHVLKLNTQEHHWAGGCAEEIATWNDADETLRAFLCPIVAADPNGQWLVMPKCAPADVDYDDQYAPGHPYYVLRQTLEEYGISDQHPGNVMLYDDPETGEERLVSTDYGMTNDRVGASDDWSDSPTCYCTDCRINRGETDPPRSTPLNWQSIATWSTVDVAWDDDYRERRNVDRKINRYGYPCYG